MSILLFLAVVIICSIFSLPAYPQQYSPYSKMDDPNIKHFYMGRQEIEIYDNTPVVKYRGGGSPTQAQPGAPQGPLELPPSGFQQYSESITSGKAKNLPKVVTGVPEKAPPPKATKGTANKLVPRSASATAKSSGSKHIETYKQTYQMRPQATNANTADLNATKKVKGNLLPWANNRRKSY